MALVAHVLDAVHPPQLTTKPLSRHAYLFLCRHAPGIKERPAHLPSAPLLYLWRLWWLPEREIIRVAGVDTAVYLRLVTMGEPHLFDVHRVFAQYLLSSVRSSEAERT